MVAKPLTDVEAIRQYEEIRAKNEAKQEQDLHARISLTAGIEIDPINKQVLRRSLYPKIEIDIPPEKPDILDALHRAQATINILIGEFMATEIEEGKKQDLIHFPGVQAPPPEKPTVPYGISQIDWRENQFEPGEYAFTKYPDGRPVVESAELRKVLENAAKPVEIQGQSYWLNKARTYIYRRPIGDAKK
ncbi:hypothetical protein MUP05_06565 [Candidatus Bathyarchaeota archaeon]|nr:hypothetical protein [Candidatus Bathyarchaeota archaeon]